MDEQTPVTARTDGLPDSESGSAGQLRGDVRKRRVIIWPWVVLALIVVGVGGYFLYPRLMGHAVAAAGPTTGPTADRGTGKGGRGSGAIPVVIAPARTGNLPIYLTGLGTVTPLNTVTVHSRVDGEIMKLNFMEGQEVQAGDPLVQIDPRPFEVQLQQAQGQLGKDQASLDNARLELKRYQDAGASVSAQELDTAAVAVKQFEQTIIADQAAINAAQLQLTYSKLVAPISGRIGLRMIDQGNIVHASDAQGLMVITQLEPISVIFSIPQTALPELMDAMRPPGKLNGMDVDAFDQGYQRKLGSGKLEAIDNQIDSSTGTIRLKATFQNEDRRLFPNQFVNIRLLERTLENVVLVPTAAIQRGPDGTFVYVIDDDKKASVRKVNAGAVTGDTTAIESGVAAGEWVVTDGVDKLSEGAAVTAHSTTTTRPGHGGAEEDHNVAPTSQAHQALSRDPAVRGNHGKRGQQ